MFATLLAFAPAIQSSPLIIPQPKSAVFGFGEFAFTSDLKWDCSTVKDHRLEEQLTTFLPCRVTCAPRKDRFITGQCGHASVPDVAGAPEWLTNAEGYRLVVTTNGITIQASNVQGTFYALQTLKQVLTTRGTTQICPVLQIEDWPSMRFRGAHWFPSASGAGMDARLITNVFGPLKFNASVIQCEAAKWDSHPEIAATNSIAKRDLKNLITLCRNSFIEPIPLINLPGHAEWIFRNGQNLGFCEDPKTPYAYCVKNPKSWQFFQDIAGECCEVFQAKQFHVGHDEIAMRGRFPNPECPRCRDAGMTALMTKHANRVENWLANRGVKETMIWGDMLLGPGEAKDATHARTLQDAKERRDRLSRNITIIDWHYVGNADATSFKLFRKEGFNIIAASWYQPANIYSLSQAVKTSEAEGLLQTTWMGYFPDEKQLTNAAVQFNAFILAAEYSWSGRTNNPAELRYNPAVIFSKLYNRLQ